MRREVIPWRVFLDVFQKQPIGKLDEWLADWSFGDDSAILQRAPAKSERDLRPTLENVLAELSQLARRQTIH